MPHLVDAASPQPRSSTSQRWCKVRAATHTIGLEARATRRHPYFYAITAAALAVFGFAATASLARYYNRRWYRNPLLATGKFVDSADLSVTVHAASGIFCTAAMVLQAYLGSVEERDAKGNMVAGRYRDLHRVLGRLVVLPSLLLLVASSGWVQLHNPDGKSTTLLRFQWVFLLLVCGVVYKGLHAAMNGQMDVHRDCMMAVFCLIQFAPLIRVGRYLAQLAAGLDSSACDVTIGRLGSQIGTAMALVLSVGATAAVGRLPQPRWLLVVPVYFSSILLAYGGYWMFEDAHAYELCYGSALPG